MVHILSICLKKLWFSSCMIHCCCSVSKSVCIKVLDMPKRIHTFILGFFDVNHDEASSLDICRHHRDRLGIYWRGRCKNCQVPPEVAKHKSAAVKGDHSLVTNQSQYIKKITGKLVPVGSGTKVFFYFFE